MTEKARRAASPGVCADRDRGVAANAGVGGFGGLNSDAEKIFCYCRNVWNLDDRLFVRRLTGRRSGQSRFGGATAGEERPMCDYSLHAVESRPAQIADKLISTSFRHSSTSGFAAQDNLQV